MGTPMRILLCRTAGMGRRFALCFVASVMAFTSTSVSAQVNSWTNPASGNWDDASSWSLGALPGSSQPVMITNSDWKAVAINPSTPVNFPDSMTVSNLTIVGSTNTENVLLLNYFGTNVPLTVLNGLTLQDDAQILNFDSALVVEGGTVLVTNSQINQDGGLVCTTNAQMYLQNAVYNLTNGVFEGGQVFLGLPVSANFNQYGGTAVFSNLAFGQGVRSAGGNYALYGGNLSLPNGLTITGGNGATSSYFQSGGTNQTTSVYLEPNEFGDTPSFTLNGGLLLDNSVNMNSDNFGGIAIVQNGGTHGVSNGIRIGGSANGFDEPIDGIYYLNGGTLSADTIVLDASGGDAEFIQTNGVTQVGEIQAGGDGAFYVPNLDLSGGTLAATNIYMTDGGSIQQNGGSLVVSNTLSVVGFRNPAIAFYTTYEFLGGTLAASNIIIGGEWIIGDSSISNLISNPGSCSLSGTLQIGNAVAQLGSFILAGDATIDLAGGAIQLSFANSSGASWSVAAMLVVTNWDGSPSGGGAEQLIFGSDQTGLTQAQLSQIWFRVGSDLYSAKILSTGEMVPDQVVPPPLAFSRQGNNLVLNWLPGYSLQTATNVTGPYVTEMNSPFSVTPPPYTNDMTSDPQRFFRIGP
jgi:hypothetical protein